jgi:hypothetical protein
MAEVENGGWVRSARTSSARVRPAAWVIGTVYDMVKAADRGMRVEGVRLLHKSGGRSGVWEAASGTSAVMRMPGRLSSGSHSTRTFVSSNGWQSGISSWAASRSTTW